MRLALAQINPTVGDLAGNSARIAGAIAAARRLGADVVAFPELALSGYPPEDLLLKRSFLDHCRAWLDRTAAAAAGIVAIIGFPDGELRNVGNAAAVIADGRLVGVYRKALLPNYGVFDEVRYFKPGDGRQVFEILGATIGISICEDIWHRDGPPRVQAEEGGARLLINISASPYHAGKGGERALMLASRARDHGVTVAYVNLVGGQDELVFDGQSMVFAPDGRLVAEGPQFEEDLIVLDLDIGGDRNPVPAGPTGASIRTTMVPPTGERTSAKPPLPARPPAAPLDRLAEIYRALVVGTRDYVRKNGFAKVVIGLSGGVDSALTACVAVDALGAGNVVGVAMPSPYSSPGSISDAQALAGNLGMELRQIAIGRILEAYLDELKPQFAGRPPDVAEENVQARIRGNLLMALSNKLGWLVLTTGNKSELAVGYCTLYGDMAGGFAVIKDIPKTLVYELARWRNGQSPLEAIPESVLTKEPSAELRPDQRDTDSLPPYSVLDPILHAYVEEDRGLNEIVGMGFARDVVERVIRMVDHNEYKRRQAAPGVKITPKAFGRDRRLPITNRYTESS
jgi:NAD+ synthase (glutamine-hydrolysing)